MVVRCWLLGLVWCLGLSAWGARAVVGALFLWVVLVRVGVIQPVAV